MDEDELLQSSFNRQKKSKPSRTISLADSINEFMKDWVSPRQARFGPIIRLWQQLLPEELYRHCEITDIRGGQLNVRADSPSHASELRWCSSEIVLQLQKNCPSAKIKKIKVTVG